jgi:2Fe-2S ferredoxin
MITIHVTDREGAEHVVETAGGTSLMLVLRNEAGLPVEGLCGGCAACGTCHVLVESDWMGRLGARTVEEEGMLDQLYHTDPDRSRLACQIPATAEIDGLRLRLAPSE